MRLPKLSAIVMRCLRKAPGERFQTMSEVRAALEQVTLQQTARTDDAPSIAVLPFANMSADKENEYFSDGLAEEILNLLAKIPGLKVIARTSSFAFRGKEQDITQNRRDAARADDPRRQRAPRRQPHPRHRAVDQRRRRHRISGRSATTAT